jgi:hypothetical protein
MLSICPAAYRPEHIGVSPSGKASAFGADIRWFESSHPSQDSCKSLIFKDFYTKYMSISWHLLMSGANFFTKIANVSLKN